MNCCNDYGECTRGTQCPAGATNQPINKSCDNACTQCGCSESSATNIESTDRLDILNERIINKCSNQALGLYIMAVSGALTLYAYIALGVALWSR